jgi:hypothetical protein
MEKLKADCDAYGEDTQQVSNDQLERLLNANPRNNTFKLLYYISEHIQVRRRLYLLCRRYQRSPICRP